MKTFLLALPAALAVAASFQALAAGPLPPDTPLVEDQGLKVTAADFEGYILRIPEADRPVFRASPDRISSVVDAVYVTRALAERARAAGLDKAPEVQARLAQLQEGLLADLYMQKVEKEVRVPNLEQRARELYKAEAATTYAIPEQIAVQHILINLNGRTRDMALARAKEVHQQVAGSNEEFMVLARRFSEDPDVRRNSGELGFVNPASLEPAFAQALVKMNTKGQLSEPVETKYGFHIIRYLGRKPAGTVPFEDVRNKLIGAERTKLMSERRAQIVSEIRDSKTVIVHKNNVDALRTSIDLSKADKGLQVTPSAPASDTQKK